MTVGCVTKSKLLLGRDKGKGKVRGNEKHKKELAATFQVGYTGHRVMAVTGRLSRPIRIAMLQDRFWLILVSIGQVKPVLVVQCTGGRAYIPSGRVDD